MGKLLDGWTLYYMVVLFKEIKCKEAARKDFMNDEAKRIFKRMTYRLVRYPESEAGWNLSPLGIWVVDYSVPKDADKDISDYNLALANDGMHGNAVFAIPPAERTRLKVPFYEDLQENRTTYVGNMISTIHVSTVRNPEKTCDYCLKSLKSRRSNPDDVVVFPFSPTEHRHLRPWSKERLKELSRV